MGGVYNDILKIRRKGSKIFLSLQIHAEKTLAASSESSRRAIKIKLKIDRIHPSRSWLSRSRSAHRVRAVTRIDRASLCVWMEGENRCGAREKRRQKRTARERERQLEKEEDGRDPCFIDSTARLLDAGRWVGSECCSSWLAVAVKRLPNGITGEQ